ncbi:sorting nexin mvp1 [Pseudohyphozyma bogoriensis]|nr:sorting nexin mvp1 [Pseudohyphozyma bogoriensis]
MDSPLSPQQPSSWSSEPDPWGTNNSPSKQPSTLSVLSSAQIPPLYERLFANAADNGSVSVGSLKALLSAGGIKASSVEKILSLVAKSNRITRQEFYIALALLARAQTFLDISVEAVASSEILPLPTLPSSFSNPPQYSQPTPPTPIRTTSESSTDPWNNSPKDRPTPETNGNGASGGQYGGASTMGFSFVEDDEFGEGLGTGGGFYGNAAGAEWTLQNWDKVLVRERDELGGYWMNKHTVWIVQSSKHNSQLERRYSDFVWLLDCLTRRYPFRLLPSLPPKRVAISGHYLASDDLFLERRRRGLERFMTFLVNHPVMKHDALELAAWRKSTPISLDEESVSRILTPSEESQIPSDVEVKLSSLRSRILPLIEHWTKISSLFDRIAHRRQNQGGDLCRLEVAIESGLETERSGWRPVEVEGVEGITQALAVSVGEMGRKVEGSSEGLLERTVEDVKRHRELYLNLRDLFGRQVTHSHDAVDKLKKRVESNMRKVETVREVRKPAFEVELDKLASSIEADQRQIDLLLRRRIFIKWCLWQETLWMFRCTSLLQKTLKDYVKSEGEFMEVGRKNWESAEARLNGFAG